jgi:hypothetical protein
VYVGFRRIFSLPSSTIVYFVIVHRSVTLKSERRCILNDYYYYYSSHYNIKIIIRFVVNKCTLLSHFLMIIFICVNKRIIITRHINNKELN